MKLKLTNKIFTFIVATILFSCLIQFACAQKTTGYPCRCGARQYGCGPTDTKCVAYCASRCRINDSTAGESLKDSLAESASRPTLVPSITPENDSSKLIDAAQNATRYNCNCFVRGYGCARFDSYCIGYCGAKCGRIVYTEKIFLKENLALPASGSTDTPLIILVTGNNSSQVFENESSLIKLNANPETSLLMKWNWALLQQQ